MGRSGEEDHVSDIAPALDEAFERMAAASFELPNGFVNHGATACEALAMLGCSGDIDSWARRFAGAGGASAGPVVPAGFEWRQAQWLVRSLRALPRPELAEQIGCSGRRG